ncbi:hypothetical protein [Marinomonas ushuaiensis]|nr:hypothetical protein [Marinomonas ushuaiensis]
MMHTQTPVDVQMVAQKAHHHGAHAKVHVGGVLQGAWSVRRKSRLSHTTAGVVDGVAGEAKCVMRMGK